MIYRAKERSPMKDLCVELFILSLIGFQTQSSPKQQSASPSVLPGVLDNHLPSSLEVQQAQDSLCHPEKAQPQRHTQRQPILLQNTRAVYCTRTGVVSVRVTLGPVIPMPGSPTGPDIPSGPGSPCQQNNTLTLFISPQHTVVRIGSC